MLRTLVLSFVLGGLLGGFNLSAQAQTQDVRGRSKKHFDQAEIDYRLGRFEKALVGYQKAYELFRVPEFLFNIGQCQRNLGHVEKAIFSFKAYLRDAKSPRDRERVQALVAQLEKQGPTGKSDLVPRVSSLTPPPPPSAKLTALGPEESSKIYKTWWFWTAVTVSAALVGGGIYWANQPSSAPDGSLGNGLWR